MRASTIQAKSAFRRPRCKLVPPNLELVARATLGERRERQIAELVFNQFNVEIVKPPG